MKARIKATGETYEIVNVFGFDVLLSDGNVYDYTKLEYIDKTDWQQVRIQASIEFAAQILANHGGTPASVANNAVDYADALIKKLKGGQDEINN